MNVKLALDCGNCVPPSFATKTERPRAMAIQANISKS